MVFLVFATKQTKNFKDLFICRPYRAQLMHRFVTIVAFYRRKPYLYRSSNISMISKKQLKGKHVTYRDRDGKFRTERVVRVAGNYLTVRTTRKIKRLWKFPKRRIYKNQVLGHQRRKLGLEPINWK